MKTLINNLKKWLSPKPVEDEPHINWFGVINNMKDDARDVAIKESSGNIGNHTKTGTIYTLDISPKSYTDEVERLQA